MKVGDLRQHAHELGFSPQDEVRWLSPSQLVRTAGKVAVSSLFADFADRREVQAALPAPAVTISPGSAGLWVDYVADVGDGFDSTYTVAWLLAQQELQVADHRLPRGDVLVLGGDEVYPTPSATGYEDRTTGPYRAALPSAEPQPTLLAVPGNHDWYDGLTAFLRIFAQRRPIGGWRTAQTRSYFAAKLPDGWWLVGLDTQLGTYIDQPQIRYFKDQLSSRLQPGDAVIVCAPTPTWVHTGRGEVDAFNSLHFFEREVVEHCDDPDGGPQRETGARVRVWISGDQHHYARYAERVPVPAVTSAPTPDAGTPEAVTPEAVTPEALTPDAGTAEAATADGAAAAGATADGARRQLFTSGMGGAYLLGTADLAAELELPPRGSRMSGRGPAAWFDRVAAWPTPQESRRMEWGIFSLGSNGIVTRNPGLWRLIGLVHAFFLPVLTFVLGLEQGLWPGDVLLQSAPSDVLGLVVQLGTWFGAAILLASLVPLVHLQRPRLPPVWLLAVVLQLLVAFGTLAAAVALPWPRWQSWQLLAAAGLGAFVVSGFVGCYALALYLAISRNRGVLFSAQAIEDGKGFLRMHLDAQGRLTVYPLLVTRICRDWELEPVEVTTATVRRMRPVPAGGAGQGPPQVQLIEAPVVIDR